LAACLLRVLECVYVLLRSFFRLYYIVEPVLHVRERILKLVSELRCNAQHFLTIASRGEGAIRPVNRSEHTFFLKPAGQSHKRAQNEDSAQERGGPASFHRAANDIIRYPSLVENRFAL
jgi:hypothetical protein